MDWPDWPRHLQASWHDYAERGEVDGQYPPNSMRDAYLLVAESRAKRLRGIPWGDGTHNLVGDEYPKVTSRNRSTRRVPWVLLVRGVPVTVDSQRGRGSNLDCGFKGVVG